MFVEKIQISLGKKMGVASFLCGGGGGRLRDFFCDHSANLELVVAIVIFPNFLRQFLNLTLPNDCNLIPSGHGTRHERAEMNLKT